MEDEYHFLNICPAYQEKKMFATRLFGKRIQNKNKQNVTQQNIHVSKRQKLIAKHVFECFEKKKGEDGKK